MNAELRDIFVERPFQPAQLSLAQVSVDKDEGVVKASALDEVEVKERDNLVQEYKCAAGSYLSSIIRKRVEMGHLATYHAVGEVYGTLNGEFVTWFCVEDGPCGFVLEM